jgi:putative ABC transport system ATP-binding protein
MLLETEELSREYKQGSRSIYAVRDVSIKINEGDLTIIVGRSGSGKSTLLNLLGGILAPSHGRVILDGCDLTSLKDKSLSALRNDKIGFVPQGYSILSNLSVIDNVRLPFYLHKRYGNSKAKAFSLLERLGIAHLANAYPKQLSGGELRRVAIARALINNPILLLADEPTNDLDTESGCEVMKLFSELAADGTAILLVSHDPEVISYGKQIYQMRAGKLYT